MCACGCDTTRNITKRQLNLLRQQTLFFAYPMAGLMMKRIGCGTKPVRQWAMPNQRRYFIETSYREIEEILNKFPELREEYKRFGKYVG